MNPETPKGELIPLAEAIKMLPPEKVERPRTPLDDTRDRFSQPLTLMERLAANAADAWRELDAIPVPQTTFYDTNGLPARTILADGTELRPARTSLGLQRDFELEEVGADLRPLRGSGQVVWSGSIPDNWRNSRERTQEEQDIINQGYDDAAATIHSREDDANGRPAEWEKYAS